MQNRQIGLVILALAILSACSQNEIGIFQSIELEREIEDDRNLGNELNVGAFAKVGSYYAAAAGTLYLREALDEDYLGNDDDPDTGRSQWVTLESVSDNTYQNYTTASLVASNVSGSERIYAVFVRQDASDSQLVELTLSGSGDSLSVAASRRLGTGDAGTDTGGGAPNVSTLTRVFAVDEDLDGTDDFVVVGATLDGLLDYTLFASSDGSTFTEWEAATTRAPTPYVDAVATGLANDGTLFVAASGLLRDTDSLGVAGGLSAPDAGKSGSATYMSGIYDSVGGLTWLSDNQGYLYSSGDLASWERSDQIQQTAQNTDTLPFTDLAAVPVGFAGSTTVLLVGTAGFGYRVIGTAGSVSAATAGTEVDTDEYVLSSPAADDSNYEASELSDAVVNAFFVDPDPQTNVPVPTAEGDPDDPSNPYELIDGHIYFAATSSQGLWRALSYDGSVQWIRE